MQFDREKNKQKDKKATKACLKVYEKHMKIHETKIPWPALKEDKCCFIMITKLLAESIANI